MKLPWLLISGGIRTFGSRTRAGRPEHVEAVVRDRRCATGVSSLRQSGSRRSSPIGSITAPDRIWAPTSEPFSTTTTDVSGVELLQPDRGGEPGRPGADDDDVELHRLAGGKVRCTHAGSTIRRERHYLFHAVIPRIDSTDRP